MSVKVIQSALSLAATGGQPFHLQLTGGEPTLVPELIEKAAKLARDTGRCGSMGIQTNATRLTIELMDLFKTYAFQVGVSLDGPPEIQQQQRGMTSETLRGLRMLDGAGIPFRVTTVVTRTSAEVLDQLVLTLAGFSSIRGIGLDLLVDKGNLTNPDRPAPASSQTLIKGVQKMLKILDTINTRRAVPIRLRERDRLLAHKENEKSAFCHACRAESIAVQPDGKIFPCGQTSGDRQFFAGTVRAPRLERLNALNRFKPLDAPCDTCSLKKICPGDCPSRLHYNRRHRPFQMCDLYCAIWDFAKKNKKPPGGKTP